MKKILIINGSARPNGNTRRALEEAEKVLHAEGLETEYVSIGAKPVHGCIGCGACQRKMDGKCIFADDIANELSAKAAGADGFIIGAPVYFGQPAGALLALLQRMMFSNRSAFSGKPVANVAICRRAGATAAYQTMNMPWQMVNSPIVTSQYWNIVYGREPGEAAYDAEGLQTMRTMAHNLAYLVKSLDPAKAPAREDWQPTHFVRDDLK